MSVGVTVHDVADLPSPMVSNPLADLENVRKIANEKLRIRRLVQVRQQSKQLAAKVRQNYQQAKEKELAKIEQTKRAEMKAWKRQHIRTLQDEYARNVCEVGEAHRAAEAAEECAVWFEEKRATQQAVAMQRGRVAEAHAAHERDRKEAQKEAKRRKKPYVPSKSIAVQASIPVVEPPAVEVVDERKDAIPLECGSSTDPTPSPYEHFRSSRHRMNLHTVPETVLSDSDDEQYCPGKENVPAAGGHEYSATAFTSPSDFRLNVVTPPLPPKPQRLQPFTQITELIQQRRRQQQQYPLHDATRQPTDVYRDPYATQKTVQFDDVSDNTLSFPTSSVLPSDERPFAPHVANESPRKVPPRKMAEKPRIVPTAQQGKGANRGTVGRRVVPPESSSSAVSYADGACSTKVQYYDCNTKYRKEYDQPVGFVQREQYRSDDPTGMEEANRYEQLQQELAKARSEPSVDRTKPALEKQQTRKDYEKLSKELDNLTRTENKLKSLAVPAKSVPSEATLKQQAATRQRKANEAIESLLRQRSLVTCPVVQMPTEPRHHPPAVRPSVVNVAEMRAQQQGKDVSTDSCASIVLDTFERPGIPLPPSEAIGGGEDKIEKLKQLLDQINEQRQALTEEIARERVEQATKSMADAKVSTTAATKLEIERLERMKRRQEELLEQQQLLQKREQEVEELGRQLEEKMAVLQRKQQKQQQKDAKKATTKPKVHIETKGHKGTIDVDVVQPSSVGSSISETSKDSYESVAGQAHATQPPPVKIIITVNDKGKASSKGKQKGKAAKEKEQKTESAVQQPPVTVAQEPTRTEILKPLASRKDAAKVPKRKVMDFSPGSSSTTSTIYRPLPPKIGSLKILQREAPAAAIAPDDGSKGTSGQKYNLQKKGDERSVVASRKDRIPSNDATNLNPNLLKYIVRLLGMSRQSIDQLGVSSTSVSTPNASVVNVSSNNAGGQPGLLAPNEEESERATRLRKFIDENYNFLQEIDETLRRSSTDQSTLGSSGERSGLSVDAEVSRVEGIWMETLRRRERTMKKQQRKGPAEGIEERPRAKEESSKKQSDKTKFVQPAEPRTAPIEPPAVQPPPAPVQAPAAAPTIKEGSLKSILKSPKRDTSAKVAKIITPQGHVEVINLSDREEQEILERYSQLTERCSQRITELSQMINQVREEKRRLIEDSLSSLEQQESSTKYMDLPPTINRPTAIAATQPPSVVVPSPPPAGQSAPSVVPPPPVGDDPVSEEIDNIFSSKQIGLSKDSGIAMSRPLTASDIRESPSEEGSQGKEPLPFEPFLKDIPKAPSSAASLSAGGPHLEGGGPGPKAPLRRSTPPVAIARFSPQLPDELPMHELSTIPEVETPAPPVATSRGNDHSAVSVAAGENTSTAEVLAEARNRLLLNEATVPDIGYDRFPNYEEYVRSTASGTGTGTASFVRLELEQTVEPNEKSTLGLDVTEEREPGRLAYRKFSGQAPAFDITEEGEATLRQSSSSTGRSTVNKSGSDTSLPDVVAELRKWNIIVKPFHNSLDNSNRSTPLSETQDAQAPAQLPAGDKQPRNAAADLQPLSESFERDLEKAGFRWASSMLKRSSQLEQHSSGSSPSSLEAKVIGPNDETVENAETDRLGKPLDLAEFITRQLMVRTQSDLQSNSSLSSSSHGGGSHSTLLRSLLNLSRLDSSNSNASPLRELLMHTPTDGKSIQRTSTPVASKSTASGNSFRPGGHGNTDPTVTNNRTETEGLFSGESRLSSVHWSSSSGNSSDRQQEPTQLHRLTVPDVRLERQSSVSNRDAK